MLTVARCEQASLERLGYSVMPVGVSTLEIVNRVGRWLCSAHPWTWLNRLGTLDVTGGQTYVSLASLGAVSAVVKVQFTDSSALYLSETSLDDILNRRTSILPTSPLYYALNNQIATDGTLTKVLELDAAPVDDITGGITIYFRAGIQAPAGGAASARIAVPEEWEGLFLLACMNVLAGHQEPENGDVDDRLTKLKRCDEFADLVRMDGMSQSNMGYLQGGGVLSQMAGLGSLRYPRSIGM